MPYFFDPPQLAQRRHEDRPIFGSPDRLAGEATSRPVTFAEVFSTLYHNLGINVRSTTLPDLSGRPQYFVEKQTATGVGVIVDVRSATIDVAGAAVSPERSF